MLRKTSYSAIIIFGLLVFIVPLLLINCSRSYNYQNQTTIETKAEIAEQTRIMYLDISHSNDSYQLDGARIFDSVYTTLPTIKIYGIYGIEVDSKNDEILFEQYIWMNPLEGEIRLPFNNDVAYVDLIQRKKDGKYIVSRFDIDEIMEKADYYNH